MAKVHFFYSTMNAGKSTALLQSNYNYNERGMDTLLFLPKVDADANKNKIHSRIGLIADAISVDTSFNFFEYVQNFKNEKKVDAILIDEVQFLTKDQVRQICKISDTLNIPSMCYGIRTDFRGELFEGSSELLALADNLIELKTVCDCGRKATMVVRVDESGKVITAGEKIQIGGNDTYKVYCRKHFRELTNLI
ncbi:MAG: thymidine kinase [Gammaproteobacteria bacterium TMED104]|nr:MAG: thymidine kinase [Gammaproteobacteria bacterium TMED104]